MTDMRAILIEHAQRYPLWEVADLYKLIFQRVMGSEHAVADGVPVGKYLYQELKQLGSGPKEPLIDPISMDGAIVRVHLRPFVRRGLDVQALLQAFIRTANETQGSGEMLDDYGMAAIELAREGVLPFGIEETTLWFRSMKTENYPAVHHSQRYRMRYQPAYRVVAKVFLPEEIINPKA